jgi:hypothetical protein
LGQCIRREDSETGAKWKPIADEERAASIKNEMPKILWD